MLYSCQETLWKVADFGLTVEGTSHRAHTTNFSRGTSGYRAPELLTEENGRRTYSNKVDIWAVGCIMFEIITRRKAFAEDYASQMYSQGLGGYANTLRIQFDSATVPDSIKEFVWTLIHNMLDVNPLKRPKASQLLGKFISTVDWPTPSSIPGRILANPQSSAASLPEPSRPFVRRLVLIVTGLQFYWWLGNVLTLISTALYLFYHIRKDDFQATLWY